MLRGEFREFGQGATKRVRERGSKIKQRAGEKENATDDDDDDVGLIAGAVETEPEPFCEHMMLNVLTVSVLLSSGEGI